MTGESTPLAAWVNATAQFVVPRSIPMMTGEDMTEDRFKRIQDGRSQEPGVTNRNPNYEQKKN